MLILQEIILRIPQDHVIAVVGAGHKPGINRYLDNPETIPPLSQLEITKEKKGIPWFKIILALIPILFVVIFFLAYISGINITWNLYDFIIISMIMGLSVPYFPDQKSNLLLLED